MTEPRPKRGNLESTISDKPNARGLYEAKVWMGTKANGKPDRRHVQRKSLASVRRRVRELEAQRTDGTVPAPGKPPLIRDMLTRHLDVVLPQRGRAPKTIASYRSLCEHHIYPRWGGQRADRLSPEHVEDGLAAMHEAGLSAATIRKVYAILSSAYELQVARGNLARNPCRHVEAPQPAQAEMPSLTVAEAQSIVAASGSLPNGPRWPLALGHGLRQGEVLGLRWDYLDLDTGEMRAWFQLQRVTWRHACADPAVCCEPWHKVACPAKRCPKVRASGRKHVCVQPGDKGVCPAGCTGHAAQCPVRRGGGLVFRPVKERRHKTIWLAPEFTDLLRGHRAVQEAARAIVGPEWEDHGLVFCQWNGRPVDPRRDWADWQALLKAAGLPPHRVHAMRHSAVSMLLGEGVGIRVVQQMVGHSDIRVTERYAHVGQEQSRDASGKAGRALGL